MILLEKLKSYNIILASASPRRQKLLKLLNIDFETRALENHEEIYQDEMTGAEISMFLARQKSENFSCELAENQILITADTIVYKDEEVLHKPKNESQAVDLLKQLSGKSHFVYTGICLRNPKLKYNFVSETKVTFDTLSEEEIYYYIQTCNPYDKAGGYGIQEWIGLIAVKELKGSYFNVMGLPVQRLFRELEIFINKL
ncbi:MAG TPA: Maf family nucleotide pyrophosphatase [Bacteroidales bacterium]|nr:Maf family nucleotide pyrophosphatase [Bacteroidales bacterium]